MRAGDLAAAFDAYREIRGVMQAPDEAAPDIVEAWVLVRDLRTGELSVLQCGCGAWYVEVADRLLEDFPNSLIRGKCFPQDMVYESRVRP